MNNLNDTLPNRNNRIPVLDALKGTAVILVIFAHVHLGGLLLVRFIGVFHMPLFFIISGYLYKSRTLKDTIKINSSKILLPYFVTCCFIWAVVLLVRGDVGWGWSILWGNSKPFHGVYNGSGLLEESLIRVGSLWFFTAYFCSIIYANIFLRVKTKGLRWFVILFLFIVSVLCVKYTGIMLPFGLTTALGGVVFMFIGMELKESPSIFNNRTSLICGIFIWAICIVFGSLDMATHSYKLNLLQVVGGYYGTYICYKFLCQFKISSTLFKGLCYLGRNSLALICIHSIDRVLGITSILTSDFFDYINRGNDVLRWQFELCLKFSFVFIVYFLFMKIPLLNKVYGIRQ